MPQVTLARPGNKFMYSGIYLDFWAGYDIHRASFTETEGKYNIKFVDGSYRDLGGDYNREEYLNLYWNMIQRGWKPMKIN